MRARILAAALACCLVPAASQAAPADTYPDRPIRLVVPYAAGGGVDLLARKFAEALGSQVGQSVFVENKVGAGGTLGAVSVSQAKADGYTLLFGGSPMITNKLINPAVGVDVLKSLAPVSLINMNPFVLAVAGTSPYRSIQDILAAARQSPGKLNFASGGVGTGSHLAGAALATATGIDVVHVPYRGSVDLVPSLLGGQTQFCFPVVTAALPQVESGAVRVLGVTSARRLPILPGVPTLKEALGNDDTVIESWNGVWGPAGMPADIVAKLNRSIHETFKRGDLNAFFDKNGSPVELSPTADDFADFLTKETAKFSRIVRASKIVQF
ncbi:Bug family tripartite tricarboxylate transporter substrate binding protein [Pigmentiphaga kullae]|uniref:Tripartite-type tricarboxylate transporter receptor subunit TctC n=1 Tax=Pigmentiphaga kullae TaxID=151784 RepID=A0A4Q7NNA5_9BURK|nr:tripartite tricarboxylate transporter substrate binding protein [Pigmentiphaga kullae]RZS86699.1 tripartite-type tricarboxylate transporter receptor subunit TctC [Pigmentiphaga kullae]